MKQRLIILLSNENNLWIQIAYFSPQNPLLMNHLLKRISFTRSNTIIKSFTEGNLRGYHARNFITSWRAIQPTCIGAMGLSDEIRVFSYIWKILILLINLFLLKRLLLLLMVRKIELRNTAIKIQAAQSLYYFRELKSLSIFFHNRGA